MNLALIFVISIPLLVLLSWVLFNWYKRMKERKEAGIEFESLMNDVNAHTNKMFEALDVVISNRKHFHDEFANKANPLITQLETNEEVDPALIYELASQPEYHTGIYNLLKGHSKEDLFPEELLARQYFIESRITEKLYVSYGAKLTHKQDLGIRRKPTDYLDRGFEEYQLYILDAIQVKDPNITYRLACVSGPHFIPEDLYYYFSVELFSQLDEPWTAESIWTKFLEIQKARNKE